jgi:AcrR family transcriptional regulator
VTEIQRRRLLTAATEVVEEVGYSHMTVAHVIARARVSRKTFYEVFVDREDCFLAVFEQVVSQARLCASAAYRLEAGWREGIRAALTTLLLLIEEEPARARLCFIEALGAGERVLERRSQVLAELAEVIDRGRLVSDARHAPPEITSQGVVGAIYAVVDQRLLDGGNEPLADLIGPLMSIIVLPYLGAQAASRELRRASPSPRGNPPRRRSKKRDPLGGLNLRLTYRTVQVLTALAEQPGASNRELADASGIVDPGQISKLLRRLSRLSLVENLGHRLRTGPANSWHLTARGAEIERATRLR